MTSQTPSTETTTSTPETDAPAMVVPGNSGDAATTSTTAEIAAVPPAPPMDSTTGLLWNVGFIAIMVVMFYLLLIRPQQKRMQEHTNMVKALKKGDKVVLQSGMIGTIDSATDGSPEMTIAFVDGHKAVVLRSAIAGTYESIVPKK